MSMFIYRIEEYRLFLDYYYFYNFGFFIKYLNLFFFFLTFCSKIYIQIFLTFH